MSQPRESSPRAPDDRTDRAELVRLRAEIDRVDRGLLGLLNERAALVREVGAWKARNGMPVYSAARERDLIAGLVRDNPGPFPSGAIEPVFREIISAMYALEGSLRVAFLGPEGTYSHLAARNHFGASAELIPCASIGDVFAAVERGKAELGVVPVENTTEGVVTRTLDAFVDAEVTICGEVLQRIAHHLLSRSGRIEDVRRVASIGQALAQCRLWLERHLPHAERVETASSAAAAQLASEDPSVAAIGSALAGANNGLATIEAGIEDRRDNTTRFLLLGPRSAAAQRPRPDERRIHRAQGASRGPSPAARSLRSTRRQPDLDPVAADAGQAVRVPVLPRHGGPSRRRVRRRGARRGGRAGAFGARARVVPARRGGRRGDVVSLAHRVKPWIAALEPYKPGKPIEELERELGISGAIKLASNENPLGPSPRAIEAIRRALDDVHRYPDGASFALRAKLAGKLGVAPEQFVFGCGADEILELVAKAFLGPGDEAVFAWPSFAMYPVVTKGMGATPVAVPLDAALVHDLDAIAAAVNERTRVVMVCNPNNPTGTSVGAEAFERFVTASLPDGRRCWLIDEAYVRVRHAAPISRTAIPLGRASAGHGHPADLLEDRTGSPGSASATAVCDRRARRAISSVRAIPFNVNLTRGGRRRSRPSRTTSTSTGPYARDQRRRHAVYPAPPSSRRLGIETWPTDANFILAKHRTADVYDATAARRA